MDGTKSRLAPMITPSTSPPSSSSSQPPFIPVASFKRPRLPSRFTQSATPDPNATLDYQKAWDQSRMRLFHAWDQLAERWARPIEQDDLVDILTGDVVQDRGVLRRMSKTSEFGGPMDDDREDEPSDDAEDEAEEDAEGSADELDTLSGAKSGSGDPAVVTVPMKATIRRFEKLDPNNKQDAEDLKAFLEAENQLKKEWETVEDLFKDDEERTSTPAKHISPSTSSDSEIEIIETFPPYTKPRLPAPSSAISIDSDSEDELQANFHDDEASAISFVAEKHILPQERVPEPAELPSPPLRPSKAPPAPRQLWTPPQSSTSSLPPSLSPQSRRSLSRFSSPRPPITGQKSDSRDNPEDRNTSVRSQRTPKPPEDSSSRQPPLAIPNTVQSKSRLLAKSESQSSAVKLRRPPPFQPPSAASAKVQRNREMPQLRETLAIRNQSEPPQKRATSVSAKGKERALNVPVNKPTRKGKERAVEGVSASPLESDDSDGHHSSLRSSPTPAPKTPAGDEPNRTSHAGPQASASGSRKRKRSNDSVESLDSPPPKPPRRYPKNDSRSSSAKPRPSSSRRATSHGVRDYSDESDSEHERRPYSRHHRARSHFDFDPHYSYQAPPSHSAVMPDVNPYLLDPRAQYILMSAMHQLSTLQAAAPWTPSQRHPYRAQSMAPIPFPTPSQYYTTPRHRDRNKGTYDPDFSRGTLPPSSPDVSSSSPIRGERKSSPLRSSLVRRGNSRGRRVSFVSEDAGGDNSDNERRAAWNESPTRTPALGQADRSRSRSRARDSEDDPVHSTSSSESAQPKPSRGRPAKRAQTPGPPRQASAESLQSVDSPSQNTRSRTPSAQFDRKDRRSKR